jgi:hypothetical protein
LNQFSADIFQKNSFDLCGVNVACTLVG